MSRLIAPPPFEVELATATSRSPLAAGFVRTLPYGLQSSLQNHPAVRWLFHVTETLVFIGIEVRECCQLSLELPLIRLLTDFVRVAGSSVILPGRAPTVSLHQDNVGGQGSSLLWTLCGHCAGVLHIKVLNGTGQSETAAARPRPGLP